MAVLIHDCRGGNGHRDLQSSVGASLVTCGIIFFLLFLPIVSLVGILGIIFGPLAVTGFLTLTDIYHASYQNLVEPSKT